MRLFRKSERERKDEGMFYDTRPGKLVGKLEEEKELMRMTQKSQQEEGKSDNEKEAKEASEFIKRVRENQRC